MPRTGWRKSESDRRLPDLVSVGLLMKVFPAEVVDAVITECGRTEKRRRSLPARSMAYFAMGMALHSEGSYEDVLAMISDGLAWAHRDERSGKLANKAAISHARDRLGPEPMAMLFERVAGMRDRRLVRQLARPLVAVRPRKPVGDHRQHVLVGALGAVS